MPSVLPVLYQATIRTSVDVLSMKHNFLYEMIVSLSLSSLAAVESLHNKVYSEAQAWFASLNQMQQARIRQHLGNIPVVDGSQMNRSIGPSWMWWLLAALPLDPRAQLALLAMTSVKDRLGMLAKVLRYARQRGATHWLYDSTIGWMRRRPVMFLAVVLVAWALLPLVEALWSWPQSYDSETHQWIIA